ncbi:MAG TPA: hypothetical protein VGM62_10100 [Chthoniobacterales bacterium]|jgi:hypothetical protein
MIPSTLSFREKSAWVSLVILLIIYVPYFVYISDLAGRGELDIGTAIGVFTAALFFQIVLAIIAQVAISIRSKTDLKDERDAAIEAKGFRNAYFVLTFGICFAAMFVTMVGLGQGVSELATAKGAGATGFGHGIRTVLSTAAATQLLLLCLVLAEVTKYGTQVFCYRRGS